MNRNSYIANIALCAALAGGAYAQCPGSQHSTGPKAMARSGRIPALQSIVQAQAATTSSTSEAATASNPSIAGLWETLSFEDGMQTDDAFEMFFADGLELLNDASPILLGNVCVGLWTQTGPKTFQLHHVSWDFDDMGNPVAKTFIDETFTLDAAGQSFTATANYTTFDLTGKPITDPGANGSFTATGQRINMPTPPATNTASTKAIAGPKNVTSTLRQIGLDGTASTSADGKALTYFWDVAKGSLPAAISHGTTASPTVTFGAGRGPYTFTLTVTDSTGGVSTDTVTIDFEGV